MLLIGEADRTTVIVASTFSRYLYKSENAVVTKMEYPYSYQKMEYPYSYHMKAEGEGVPGTFLAEWNITLTALDENTVVAYQGSLHFSMVNAQLPGSLIKGIVKVLI